MLGTNLNFIQANDAMVGENSPLSLPDTLNLPLKQLISKFDTGNADTQVTRTHVKILSPTDIEASVVDDDIVWFNPSTLKYEKAINGNLLGIIDVENMMIYIFGMYTFKTLTGLTIGTKYFLDLANPGKITSDATSGILVGTAYDTNKILNVATTVGSIFGSLVSNTDAILEGTTNLYYTDARVESLINIPQSLLYKNDIPDAANLDTFLTAGIYHQSSNAFAANGSNYPVAVAGMLQVTTGNSFIYQEYHSYQGNEKIYYRAKYNITWSNWSQIATTAFVNSLALGVGQTWQDVRASRSLGVTYTNTTGKPIMVFISTYNDDHPSYVYCDGLLLGGLSDGSGHHSCASFIVPAGSTYHLGGTGTIYQWKELR